VVLPPALDSLVPVPTYRDQPATIAADATGIDLDGRPCRVPVLGTGLWFLVVFLSSECHGCHEIWQALENPVRSGLVEDETIVVITRDAGEEDVDALRRLATGSVPVVMSTATWSLYRVQGPPFFALVDGRVGTGRAARDGAGGKAGAGPVRVTTEGIAWSVEQIAADVRRARQRANAG
jgi:hypothetical protein